MLQNNEVASLWSLGFQLSLDAYSVVKYLPWDCMLMQLDVLIQHDFSQPLRRLLSNWLLNVCHRLLFRVCGRVYHLSRVRSVAQLWTSHGRHRSHTVRRGRQEQYDYRRRLSVKLVHKSSSTNHTKIWYHVDRMTTPTVHMISWCHHSRSTYWRKFARQENG